MALKFEIVEGNLKITNTANGSIVLLFSKQNIGAMANIVIEETSPVILYNIALGYNGIIFKDTLDNCVDNTETPFTPETWLLFCELNLGFNTPGASGTITVEDSYLTLPPANTQNGKFYWCQNSEGIYLTGLYYSNGTTWETSEADDIKVVANYAALPDPTTVPSQFYWCEASQGTKWLPGSLGGTYYNSGMYYSNGTTWEFLNVPYNATLSEANTGTNNDKFVTPSTLSNSNWAFTSAKVLATLLTGLSASSGTYTATDSILTAFNKLKYLLDNVATNSVPGIMKLFTSTGSDTDGTMTQKSVTDALDLKQDKISLVIKSLSSNFVTTSTANTDTNLSFPIGANEVWWVEITVNAGPGGSSAGGFYRVSAPTGAVVEGSIVSYQGSNSLIHKRITSINSLIGNVRPLTVAAYNPDYIKFRIKNGSTAGIISLGVAAAFSSTAFTLLAGGTLVANKTTEV